MAAESPVRRQSSSGAPDSDPWRMASSEAGSLLDDVDLPFDYHRIYKRVAGSFNGLVPVSTLETLLTNTAHISSADAGSILEKIDVNPSKGRVSKGEFCVALALAGLVQSGQEATLSTVSSQLSDLPIPSLDPLSPLTAPIPESRAESSMAENETSVSKAVLDDDQQLKPFVLNTSTSDPWVESNQSPSGVSPPFYSHTTQNFQSSNALEDSERVESWDNNIRAEGWPTAQQESSVIENPEYIKVFLEEDLEGRWLGRFQPYRLECDQRGTVITRRYSDFIWLLDCLSRRYPFRSLPSLPPKRASIPLLADDGFLERRRRGLQRFMNVLMRHPVFARDNLVNSFLTIKSDLTAWRKEASLNLNEEHVGRYLTPAEEMSVPTDLEEKLGQLRVRIGGLIDHWSRLCGAFERIARRKETEAEDYKRVKLGLQAAVSLQRNGWRLEECEDSEISTERVADRIGRLSDQVESHVNKFGLETIEDLKAQRDAFIAFRELFVRHARLAPDSVDRIRKRMEGLKKKIETVTEQRRDFWETEAQKLRESIETDQKTIDDLLRRRAFIRLTMWQEVQTLFHNTTGLTRVFRKFTSSEADYAKRIEADWSVLAETLDGSR